MIIRISSLNLSYHSFLDSSLWWITLKWILTYNYTIIYSYLVCKILHLRLSRIIEGRKLCSLVETLTYLSIIRRSAFFIIVSIKSFFRPIFIIRVTAFIRTRIVLFLIKILEFSILVINLLILTLAAKIYEYWSILTL